MNNIHICYTCDDNYAKYAGVSIASILYNANTDDNIFVYIISPDISDTNKEKIKNLNKIKNFDLKFIYPATEDFEEFQNIKTTDYLPIASFFRLKLASYIKDIDKVLYLDPDIVINKSLSELFNTDIQEYYCGGIPDVGYKKLGKRINLKGDEFYINSGVLLVNLKKWRDEEAEKQFINCAKEYHKIFVLGDQDIINKSFAGKILKINNKWNLQVINFCSRSDYSRHFNILHYTGGSKPWKFGSYIPLREHYFKYLDLTDWEKPDKMWHIKSKITGFFLYLKHRPLFIFRPGFFKAVFCYILNK